MPSVTNRQLAERINGFPLWQYQFELDGLLTPIRVPRNVNRHEQRRRYAFDPLVRLSGGSLQGKRVLDLGCNAGFWSLAAIEAGCDFVLGIDGRQMHVDQANLVFETKGVAASRYSFVQGNCFAHDFSGYPPFDVVLCFGLLYHVSKPVELFELMSRVNSDLLVVDTEVTPVPGSWIRVRREPLDEVRNAVDFEMVFVPTRRVIVDLAEQFGYAARVMRPSIPDYTGMQDYRQGRRRAFMCAKRSDISSVPADGLNSYPHLVGEARGYVERKLRRRR